MEMPFLFSVAPSIVFDFSSNMLSMQKMCEKKKIATVHCALLLIRNERTLYFSHICKKKGKEKKKCGGPIYAECIETKCRFFL